ncbi:hypothetical protein C1H46_007552 [Malus baccata]|uniref:Uncharacterized protein n=1 Tax=Malus baccata TaxID=106549 RepID=A0A540N6Z7_MALBA|nr:hypothetical protein C1H46_007552 [Malus baccata]
MYDWIRIKIGVENEIETERCWLAVGVFSSAAINGKDVHGWTALHKACFKGKIEVIRTLLEKGVDMDAKDEDGYTALHCAAESGHVDMIKMLLKKGVDAETQTNKGVTALQIAESLHYVGITRILIHRGVTKDNSNMAHILTQASVSFGKKIYGTRG